MIHLAPCRPLTDLARPLQVDVASRHLRFPIVTIFLALQILTTKRPLLMVMQSVFRNTLQPFNALYAQNASHVHTICDLTCVHIQMNAHSSVQFVAKHLLVNMTENGMKGFIQARRNSFARVSLSRVASGVADVDLPVRMLWVDIFALKLGEYASSLYLMRKR
jgi:hypothetical protein